MAGKLWVIVLGCPRSGTTWAQLLLGQHPDVATCPETHLVDGYLAPLYDRVGWERREDMTGLTSVLEAEELERLLEDFTAAARRRIVASHGIGSQVFVTKTPQNALHPDLLLQHFPQARFLHVIRDPRDVVASLLAASKTWGEGWAPSGPVNAARLWVRHVRGARRLADSPGYRELYFEDLKDDPAGELAQLHEWLELSSDREMRRETVDACSLERLRKEPEQFDALPEKVHRNAEQFFRKGGTDRPALGRSARRAVEFVAREEMRSWGYETGFGRPPTRSARVVLFRAINRVADMLDHRLRSLASGL